MNTKAKVVWPPSTTNRTRLWVHAFTLIFGLAVHADMRAAEDRADYLIGVREPSTATSLFAMMDGMSGMGGMGGNMPPGGAMPNTTSPPATQDPMADPSDADMMGRMRGAPPPRRSMSSMASPSRLPGFPGASHLYHVGASGFFLDHPQHITLTTDQQTALNRAREKSLLDRASFDRRIEDAEQVLWTLTAAEAPDIAKIETQVRAIERLRGDQRIAFIRAVGEAGKILTAEQQAALLGTKPAAGAPPAATKPAPMTHK